MVKQHKVVYGADQAPMNSKGACLWFTGRSGAGKSTITNALLPLLEMNGRVVSVLDVIPLFKKRWCEKTSEGKILRKAFVASEIVRHGGVAICVTVSARRQTREAAREIIGPENFIELFVDVPPEVALARKAKRKRKPSRVKRARHAFRRLLSQLPFRNSPGYEVPLSPDLTIDAVRQPPEEGAEAIFQLLVDRGFLALKEEGDSPRSGVGNAVLQPVVDRAAERSEGPQSRTDRATGNGH